MNTRYLSILVVTGIAFSPGVSVADGFLHVDLTKPVAHRATGEDAHRVTGEEELGTNIWLGPSVGFDVFTYDTSTKQYAAGIIPGVGYGLKYKPAWWKLSDAFLALDVFVSAVLADDDPNHSGSDHFNIDVIPIITFMDWVSVGYGPRFQIGLDTEEGDHHGLFSFGVRKSI